MRIAALSQYICFFIFLFFLNHLQASYPTCAEASQNVYTLDLNGYSGTLPFEISPPQTQLFTNPCSIASHNSTWIAFIVATSSIVLQIDIDFCTPPLTENCLQIYPNPTDEHIFLDFLLENEDEVNLEIYNTFGQRERIILQNKKYQKGISKNKINLEGLSSGTYFIHLKTKEGSLVKRFIKL